MELALLCLTRGHEVLLFAGQDEVLKVGTLRQTQIGGHYLQRQ